MEKMLERRSTAFHTDRQQSTLTTIRARGFSTGSNQLPDYSSLIQRISYPPAETDRDEAILKPIDRALIFDMDGILIDTEPLWRRAEMDCFAELGLSLDEADCLLTQGQRIDEAVAFWFERAPWTGPSCAEVTAGIVARLTDFVEREGVPMAGVREALDWAARSNWRLALASSSPSGLIECVLGRLELVDRFEVARSAEGEEFGKPHPAVYLRTASDLRLDPSSCIAIEDSANGVLAAVAAGMRCVAVPPAETRDDPRFAEATICLNSLTELPNALRDV